MYTCTSGITIHTPSQYIHYEMALHYIHYEIDCILVGYVGLRERQSSVGNRPVRALQCTRGRGMPLPLISSPPPMHGSGTFKQVHLHQLSQPLQSLPACVEEVSHVNYNKNHCSSETVPFYWNYDKKDTQTDERYTSHHFHQPSNEDQRMTSASSTVAGECCKYIQKSTVTTKSTAEPRSSTGA